MTYGSLAFFEHASFRIDAGFALRALKGAG